jgi:glycosyltransferase involved in cell wall biosynthesis
MTLDIVIPAFNESRQITALFDKLRVIAFPSFIHAVQFICVNDCSTDQTKEVVEAYQQQYPSFNLLLLSHDQNKGKGAAVRTGIEAGRGDLVLIQDGDLELSPSDIPCIFLK